MYHCVTCTKELQLKYEFLICFQVCTWFEKDSFNGLHSRGDGLFLAKTENSEVHFNQKKKITYVLWFEVTETERKKLKFFKELRCT